MKIAIMQPYIYPYYGYYQMIEAVDKFIILDDVNFIKKGWINKNTLLNNKKERYMFTVPLKKVSQNVLIKDTMLSDTYRDWKNKFYKLLYHFYGKQQNYQDSIEIITEIMDKEHKTISSLSAESLIKISNLLEIDTEFVFSSDLKIDGKYDMKLINICKYFEADEYINSIGGLSLYSKEKFIEHDIKLSFVDSKQNYDYVSILHLLMSKDMLEIRNNLTEYEFK